MKLQAIKCFKDLKKDKFIENGEEFTVDERRGVELINAKVAIEVKNDKQEGTKKTVSRKFPKKTVKK